MDPTGNDSPPATGRPQGDLHELGTQITNSEEEFSQAALNAAYRESLALMLNIDTKETPLSGPEAERIRKGFLVALNNGTSSKANISGKELEDAVDHPFKYGVTLDELSIRELNMLTHLTLNKKIRKAIVAKLEEKGHVPLTLPPPTDESDTEWFPEVEPPSQNPPPPHSRSALREVEPRDDGGGKVTDFPSHRVSMCTSFLDTPPAGPTGEDFPPKEQTRATDGIYPSPFIDGATDVPSGFPDGTGRISGRILSVPKKETLEQVSPFMRAMLGEPSAEANIMETPQAGPSAIPPTPKKSGPGGLAAPLHIYGDNGKGFFEYNHGRDLGHQIILDLMQSGVSIHNLLPFQPMAVTPDEADQIDEAYGEQGDSSYSDDDEEEEPPELVWDSDADDNGQESKC